MRFISAASATLSVALISTSLLQLVSAECGEKAGGKKCDKSSPCCAEGYCDSKASFCMASRCDPKYSYSADSCWPVPHCVDRKFMFKDAKFTTADKWDGNPGSADLVSEFQPNQARITDEGLVMELLPPAKGKKQGFGATVSMTRWIEFGKVTVRMKSGTAGWGVVSSFIIKNPQGDEADYEWIGKQPNAVQTNYFFNGILDFSKGRPSFQLAPTQDTLHEYTFDWSPERFIWMINGKEDRRLNRADTWDAGEKIFKYPSREALIQFSIWDGGADNPGTAQWSGTPTDWSGAGNKFTATVQSVDIDCYFKGNETTWKQPKKPVTDDVGMCDGGLVLAVEGRQLVDGVLVGDVGECLGGVDAAAAVGRCHADDVVVAKQVVLQAANVLRDVRELRPVVVVANVLGVADVRAAVLLHADIQRAGLVAEAVGAELVVLRHFDCVRLRDIGQLVVELEQRLAVGRAELVDSAGNPGVVPVDKLRRSRQRGHGGGSGHDGGGGGKDGDLH
ncbi:concanavalin A-like lectin/glucanase [Ramicandelaber brevisporus]|nr:concanavalin A-like lectin/glucanase [Ramicandelaber brevisporus]